MAGTALIFGGMHTVTNSFVTHTYIRPYICNPLFSIQDYKKVNMHNPFQPFQVALFCCLLEIVNLSLKSKWLYFAVC